MLVKLTCRGRDFTTADRPRPARRRRVPHPRRGHEHPVPAGRPRRPGLPGRQGHHVVHRAAPAPADRPPLRRPRHQAAHLPRRRHGEQAARRAARPDRPGHQAAAAARTANRPPAPSSGSSSSARRASPAGCASRRPSASPTPPSATPTSRCSPPGSAPRTCSPSPRWSPGPCPQLLSLECWGGATYDVALRFLAEDPWERLAALREAVPNICLQMLLRGRNTVGYTPYPTEVTDAFVQEAAATGIDIFRIFDALNDVGQMRPAIDAVRATGTAVAEVALCYTSDLSDPAEQLYTLDYYLRLAEQIVEAGRPRPGRQGHGRAAARPGRGDARLGAAPRVRPAGAPAHPRHRGRPARHLPRRDPGRRGRRRRGRGLHGGHHLAAVAVGDRRRDRPLRPAHRPRPAGRRRPGAVLGERAQDLRPLRGGPGLTRPGGSTTTRSPAGSCPTCAPRPSRSASATASRTSRRCTPPPTGSSAAW